MKQALILVGEINRKRQVIKQTKSKHLKADYTKSIRGDIRELRTYCKYKKIYFPTLEKLIK